MPTPTSKHTHPVGTEVIYRHEGKARKAQVTEHHSETGEVHGLALYEESPHSTPACRQYVILGGVTGVKHAETPQHEITDGYFKSKV